MFSVGETLKRARLAQSLDLGTLAARTKINVKYLEAIEADDRKQSAERLFLQKLRRSVRQMLCRWTRKRSMPKSIAC